MTGQPDVPVVPPNTELRVILSGDGSGPVLHWVRSDGLALCRPNFSPGVAPVQNPAAVADTNRCPVCQDIAHILAQVPPEPTRYTSVPEPIRVRVSMAEPTRDDKPIPEVHIHVDAPLRTDEYRREAFRHDARNLAQALIAGLPGGTLDQLLIALLENQASQLRVAHREPPAHEEDDESPADDAMYYVETNATLYTAQLVAAETLGRHVAASQAGRLGTELTLPRSDAEKVAAELRQSDFVVNLERAERMPL